MGAIVPTNVRPSPCSGEILLLPMHVVNAAEHHGKVVYYFVKTTQSWQSLVVRVGRYSGAVHDLEVKQVIFCFYLFPS